MKSKHFDEPNYKTKQRFHWQSFHVSVNIKKNGKFLMLFCLFLAKVISPKAKKFASCKFKL